VLERYTDGCDDKYVNYYDVEYEDINTDHAVNVDAYCANPKCDFHLPVTKDKDIIKWIKEQTLSAECRGPRRTAQLL